MNGRVSEWFKEMVLKTIVGKPIVGSNPTPSAKRMILDNRSI
jgi:hypothetical protein